MKLEAWLDSKVCMQRTYSYLAINKGAHWDLLMTHDRGCVFGPEMCFPRGSALSELQPGVNEG